MSQNQSILKYDRKNKTRIISQIPMEMSKTLGIPKGITKTLHNHYCEVLQRLMWRGNRVMVKGLGTFWRRENKIYNSVHQGFNKELQKAIVKEVKIKKSDHLVKYQFKNRT